MYYEHTFEQKQLSESISRWADKNYNFESRMKIVNSDLGFSKQVFKQLSELGIFTIAIPEKLGGIEGNPSDLMVIMNALGKVLILEPVLQTILGIEFLKLSDKFNSIFSRVNNGELVLACALEELNSRYDLNHVETRIHSDNDYFIVNGIKSFITYGKQSDWLIISARVDGKKNDKKGIFLLFIPSDLEGIVFKDCRSNDGRRVANIIFKNVKVPKKNLISSEDKSWEIIDKVIDYGRFLICCEAIGILEMMNNLTLEYVKNREQFGMPIGKFQVSQHRLVDMFIHFEQAKSTVSLSASKVLSSDEHERKKIVSATKFRVGEAMKYIGQQSIQLHGGMGVSNEMLIGHFFKRLSIIELTYGDSNFHLERFASES